MFEASVEEVWKALLDPVVLAAVMPGCEKLDLVDGQYVGELNIKVGPVQGKFSGKVDLKDIVAPTSYTMNVDGRGAPGFVKATASVKLEKVGDEQTRLIYDADAQVGGKIASVGQRLIEASSRAITKQSLDGLNENIKLRAAASKGQKQAEQAAAAESAKADHATPAPEKAAGASEEAAHAAPEETPPETPSAPPPPPVVLKRADPNALAAAVAKEVTKSLLPSPLTIALGIGVVVVVIWLLAR